MTGPSFLVKICGITNEGDARVAVNAGANALGFNFYPKSPRFISPGQAQQISSAVAGDYLRVGVFVNPSAEQLSSISALVPLDVVQIHGDQLHGDQLHGDDCPRSLPHSTGVWRAVSPGASTAGLPADAWLLDTPSPEFGGSGLTFDWKLAERHGGRVILAGGLCAANVAEAIRVAHPWGVDACSRLESSPGQKDPDAVRNFIDAAFSAVSLQATQPVAALPPRPSHPPKASL